MEEDGSHMTERMLQLTLEIIYLLTGENYSVVKTASLESFFCGFFPSMADRWIRRRSPVSTPPPCSSPTPERSNKRRILEVRTRLVELLAAQDMAAALPVEKWECREGSWDLYTEAMMEAEPAAEATEENPSQVMEEHRSFVEENPQQLADSSAHEYSTPQIKEEPLICEEEYSMPQIKEQPSPREEEYSTPQIKEKHIPCEEEYPTSQIKEEPLPCLHIASGHSPAEARLPKMHPDPPTHLSKEDPRPLRFDSSLFIVENHLDQEDNCLHDEKRPPHYHTTLHNADNHSPRVSASRHQEISRAEVSLAKHHQRQPAEEPLSRQEEPSPHPDISVYGQYGAAPGSSHRRTLGIVERVERFLQRGADAPPKPHPHCCLICRHRFDSQSQLEEHRAAYVGKKPYCCCACRKTFPKKDSLSIHQKRHLEVSPAALGDGGKRLDCDNGRGTGPGQKPYLCFECGKCFSSYCNLCSHKKIHTGLKPYVCSECGKRFIRSFHLRRHMIVHRK